MAGRLEGAKPLAEPMMEYRIIGNKSKWNLSQIFYIFIHKNSFGNVVWKMSPIWSQPQYVKLAWVICDKADGWKTNGKTT